MPTIRLTLEYDGTKYVGWQYQNNGRSIQSEIEKAIKQIFQIDTRIIGGGRTDAGVHACGQVASFVIDQSVEINSLARSLNAVLPEDIVVIEANEVNSDFNARFSAKGRHYKYYINQGPIAIKRNYCWQIFYKLDLMLMQKCTKQIIGEHDFSSFCRVDINTKDNLCTVTSAEWSQHNRILEFDITANRFLRGMVRTLVGTMVNVGRGYTTYDEFVHILKMCDRTMAGMTAPAKGLFLEEVIY